MTNKAAELRNKLAEAEEGRREAVMKMEDAQVERKLLQSQMAELREQQAKVKVRNMNAMRTLHIRKSLMVCKCVKNSFFILFFFISNH